MMSVDRKRIDQKRTNDQRIHVCPKSTIVSKEYKVVLAILYVLSLYTMRRISNDRAKKKAKEYNHVQRVQLSPKCAKINLGQMTRRYEDIGTSFTYNSGMANYLIIWPNDLN